MKGVNNKDMASDMKVANFRTLHYFIHMDIEGRGKEIIKEK